MLHRGSVHYVQLLVLVCVVLVAGRIEYVVARDSDELSRCKQISAQNDPCAFQDVCMECLTIQGCTYDVTHQECNALSTNSSTATVEYCSLLDPVCENCSVSATQPTCEGSSGCLCPSLCTVLSSSSLSCNKELQSAMVYFAIAVIAIIAPCLVWMLQRWRCLSSRNGDAEEHPFMALRRGRRFVAQRSRAAPPQPQRELALELESWREHCEHYKIDGNNLELKSCYVLMKEEDTVVASASEPESGDMAVTAVGLHHEDSQSAPAGSVPSLLHSSSESDGPPDSGGAVAADAGNGSDNDSRCAGVSASTQR